MHFLPVIHLNSSLLEATTYVYSSPCSFIFLHVIFLGQISLIGTELSYGIVMGHLSVEMVKMRLVRGIYLAFYE